MLQRQPAYVRLGEDPLAIVGVAVRRPGVRGTANRTRPRAGIDTDVLGAEQIRAPGAVDQGRVGDCGLYMTSVRLIVLRSVKGAETTWPMAEPRSAVIGPGLPSSGADPVSASALLTLSPTASTRSAATFAGLSGGISRAGVG